MRYRYKINQHPFSKNKMYKIKGDKLVKTLEYRDWLKLIEHELKKRKVSLDKKKVIIHVKFGIHPGFDVQNMIETFADGLQLGTGINDILYEEWHVTMKRLKHKQKGFISFSLEQ